MKAAPSRKLLLVLHLVASIGWIGALAVFLAHAIVSLSSSDAQLVAAACFAMAVAAWYVILPLALGTIATGLAQALSTPWGLVRHYWIIFKLALTALATSVLLLKLGPIDSLAAAAASTDFSVRTTVGARTSLLVHAVGGLVVLVAALVLAIYKPGGLTPRGARFSGVKTGRMPRWVRGAIVATVVLGVLMVVMAIFGSHGPRAHLH